MFQIFGNLDIKVNLLKVYSKRVYPFLKSFSEHAFDTAAFCKYIVLLYFCPKKDSSSSVSASTLLCGPRDCRRGWKRSCFPPLVRDHVSWRCFLIYFCDYYFVIYFISYTFHLLYWCRNDPGFRRWYKIIFHKGIFFYIFATTILLYNLYYCYFYVEAEKDPGFRRWFDIIFHEEMFVVISMQLLSYHILYMYIFIYYFIYRVFQKEWQK